MTNKSTEILKLLNNFNFNFFTQGKPHPSNEYDEIYYNLERSIDGVGQIQVSIVHFNPQNKNSISEEYLEGYICYNPYERFSERYFFSDFKRLKYNLSKLTLWK